MLVPGYRVSAELSQSEHTSIYRAIRERDGLPVIVKTPTRDFPTPAEQRRLEFEHRVLGRLEGPGIVKALELVGAGEHPALILEDFGASSLAERALPLPIDDFFGVALQITRALGRVHGLQVIHKDIKPHNLLATEHLERVKLIDFQVASEISRERQDVDVTNLLEGSLPYISPEQTGRMNRALDYRSDYYSLGVTLFELCTGRLPFSAPDVMGWLHCHITKAPPLAHEVNPDVPPSLSAILGKLMSKEPHDRYQSARGLYADLERSRDAWKSGEPCNEQPFALGEHDVAERFSLSQRIVGRRAEAEQLISAFESASSGPARLLLVSGYSGIGKSSLIREVHKPLTAKHGHFIAGKFDELDRSQPYGALVDAFRALTKQLLSQSDREVQALRERLLERLGAGASVMVELIPDLGRLLGPQPPAPPLDPLAAQNRFKFSFAKLIESLATPERPLVIFLDDLQWSDAATPDLIVDLFASHELRHLLIIGAYRDNEVQDGHLLRLALHRLEERAPHALTQIVLAPLSVAGVTEIVAGALRAKSDECLPLAREIFEKTRGNPFFASELLMTLYQEGAFAFQPELGRFSWDMAKVRHLDVSENVVDLLVRRLTSLHADSRAALEVAACIGSVFSLSTLAGLSGQSADTAARMLHQTIVEGLIVPLDADYRLMSLEGAESAALGSLDVSYRFQHDRVQQAAYSLVAPGEREALHLRIGRRLLAAAGPAEDSDPFTAANHLNLGFRLIESAEERENLARLNQKAGARALSATAFAVAAKYYDTAVACLSAGDWARDAALRFALFSERVSAVLMAGQRERAAELVEELFDFAPSKADRGAVFLQKCRVMVYQGKMVEAIAAVREGLALFGIDLPSDHALIDQRIGAGIGKMQGHLARVPITELVTLPELCDPERIAAMRLLFEVVPPAVMVYPPLFILVELEMFDLALCHGITAESAKNFVDCGMIQGAVLGNFEAAYQLGKTAFRVLNRYQARALASQVHFVFATYVSTWGAHYEESLTSFRESQRLGIEAGDHTHLAFAHALFVRMLLHLGRHLGECGAEARATEALFERIGATIARGGLRLCQRAIMRLTDHRENADEVARVDAELMQEVSVSPQWSFQHGQLQMCVNAVLGDWAAAERWSSVTARYQMAASTLFTVPEYHLLECLITTRQRWPEASAERRTTLLGELEAARAKLEGWAKAVPENFEHKHQLAVAEIARVQGGPATEIVKAYENAARATGNAFVHFRALAIELHGLYWLDQGSTQLAEPLLGEALSLYSQWGAVAKVRRLERQCQEWFGRVAPERRFSSNKASATVLASRTTTVFDDARIHGSLDLASVLKATRAISSEVKSERLFGRLMSAILENAAAERGALILPDEATGALWVRARAEAPTTDLDVSVLHELAAEPGICHQMVRYVARSLEALIIDDAKSDPSFGADPYVLERAVKSVLCMPVLNQGRLVAVLYVENNATTHAFSAERVETLQLIAGQAAISITNASLYTSLESKVADRTRELSAKTKKIAAMLDGMRQAVFTIDDNLEVQPEYSRYLEQLLPASPGLDLVGRGLSEVLFTGAEVGADAIATNESALRFSFGASLLIAHANADHLIREYSRQAPDGSRQRFEIDWNWITGDGGKVEKVLVTARDVTLIRGLQEAAAEAARETEIVGEILDAGVEDFKTFCDAARRVLGDHERALGARALAGDETRALFRNVHTIKGHCRTLGLHRLVEAAHATEQACASDSGNVTIAGPAALENLRRLKGALSEYERIGEKKLGRLWAGADARFKQALGAIESALTRAPERPSYPVRVLSEVRQTIHRINSVPLDQVLRETARVFPSLARELGKSVPELDWVDDGTLLAADWGRVMKDALVHTFRNALDHGIETGEERAAQGKRPQGKIALHTARDGSGIRIHLSDDGRGLPVDELRMKTGKQDCPDQIVAEAIFDFGVSTARRVSTVSGRGIGMDAVRGFLRELGGDVRIEFTGEAVRGHRPFELVFRLPTDATLHGRG